MTTEGLLLAVAPGCDAATFAPALDRAFALFDIDTNIRKACFIGQVTEESECFRATVENLDYSAERLSVVWPGYFANPDVAQQYARNPEKLANHVYALRNGNGDEASGDGWRYRGRGLIQITGRASYERTQADLAQRGVTVDYVGNPDAVGEAEGAVFSAASYWDSCALNNIADRVPNFGAPAFQVLTRKINGGLNGLAQRAAYANTAWRYLCANS